MTIDFVGGEMSAFSPSDSVATEIGTTSTYDSAFSRCALSVTGLSYMQTAQLTAMTERWTHIHLTNGNGNNALTDHPVVWLDGSDTEVVRLAATGDINGTIALQYWNGASWATAGSAVSLPLYSANQVLDVRILANSASGNLSLYVAGTERINQTVDLSGVTSVRRIKVLGDSSGGFNFITTCSQIISADEPTIGWRLATLYPSAGGADSAWTGAYTAIDETVYSDADFINSGSAAQVSTFALTGPAMTGYSVRAVGVTARARRGASGPQNIRMALRSAGTTYFSGSDIALGLGYAPVQTIWETDPATSAAWVNTNIASLQGGAKSIA